MTTLLRLTKIELLKLRKHRLSWLVLFALMLILGLQLNSSYQTAKNNPISDTPTIAEPEPPANDLAAIFSHPITNADYWQTATLPGIFIHFWRMLDWLSYAVILLGIIAVGQEFSWGTLRMTLIRGVSRNQIVWAKFLALNLTVAIYLLVLWLETAVLGGLLTRSLHGAIDGNFLNSPFWLTQGAGIGRTWLLIVPFIAFTLAVNIAIGRPGPAFTLLFMLYFLSLFAYMSLLIIIVFFYEQEGFDPVAVGNSLTGLLIHWIPHYNSRMVLYWGKPLALAEIDYSVRQLSDWFQFAIKPWLALGRLWMMGFVPLFAALYLFNRRELTP